jgi:hypothetical protein
MPRHILLPVNRYQEVPNDGTTTEITHDHLILQTVVHLILESMNIVVPHRTVLRNVVHHLHNPPSLMIRSLVLDPHKSVPALRPNPPTFLSQQNVHPPSVVEDRGWMLIPLAINLIERLHMVKRTRRCRSRRINDLKWRLLLERWRWMRIMIRRMISRKKSETSQKKKVIIWSFVNGANGWYSLVFFEILFAALGGSEVWVHVYLAGSKELE